MPITTWRLFREISRWMEFSWEPAPVAVPAYSEFNHSQPAQQRGRHFGRQRMLDQRRQLRLMPRSSLGRAVPNVTNLG